MPKNDLALLFTLQQHRIQAALSTKITSILRILQSPAFAFQLYQALRYGSLIIGAASMAWFLAPTDEIERFEALTLLAGSCTFFWIGGLLDGFLLMQKSAEPAARPGMLGAVTLICIVVSILAMVVAWVYATWFQKDGLLADGAFWFLVFWGSEMVAQVLAYQLIASERPRELMAFAVLNALGYSIAIAVPVSLGWDFTFVYMGLAVFGGIKLVWTAVSLKPEWGRLDFIKPLWRISWPLMLATLLSQSAVYVDGWLVEHYFPDQFVSFRYGAKEFPLVLLLANSMSVVRAGEITGGLRENQLDHALEGLKQSSNRLVWTLFPVAIGLLVFSGPIFELAFRDRFPAAVPIFDIFLLLTVPRLMFPQSVVRGHLKTWMMSLSAGIELVLNVGLSLLFMHFWGIGGIAGATVVAYLVEKLILLGYAHYSLGVPWRRYASVPLWMACSMALILAWVAKYLLFA